MFFCLPSSDSLYQGHQAGHLGGADMNPKVTPRRSPIWEHKEGDEGLSVLVRYTHSEESLVSGQEEDMESLLDETVSQASTELHLEKEDMFSQGLVDQFMSQHEELEEDLSMYKESSLQHRLVNFPCQDYVIPLAEEEEDLTAEFAEEQESCNHSIDDMVDTVKERAEAVLEDEKFKVDSEDNDEVNQVFSELQMDDEVACVRFVVTNVIDNAVSFFEAEEKAKLDKTAKNIISDVFSNLIMEEEVACVRFVDAFVTPVIDNAMSIVQAEEEEKLDRSAKNLVSDIFSKLQMEENEAYFRFVDEFVTSVIDNAAFIVEAEKEAKFDVGVENIINDVFSKLEIEENISCDKFIDDFITNILSDPDVISSQNVKDSPGPRETQTESPSVESDHIRQPRTNTLFSASSPTASEPVLVDHDKSVVILGTSVPNVRGLEISVSVISEAGKGRSLAPGLANASEILQRKKDQVPHPRRRSAGDVARIVFRTLSRPFRRRRRQRQARDAKSPGGPEVVLGLDVEQQDLDLGSTCHKPRTDPSSKDPGDVDGTTPTNPTKGLGLGSTHLHKKPRTDSSSKDPGDANRTNLKNQTKGLELGSPQIHHKPRADPSSKDPGGTEMKAATKMIEESDQGSTNKTNHKELRSDPSYFDPGGITPTDPTMGLGAGEASQDEVALAHRPMKRTRTQRLLRGIGRSLTRLGRPFVAFFGGG